MSIMDTLVTNRTQADVLRLQELTEKGLENMTSEELAEWHGHDVGYLLDANEDFLVDFTGSVLLVITKTGTGHKGAYNVADLNRVGAAVAYVAGRLLECGTSVNVLPKQDWSESDTPTASQMERYRSDVVALRDALAAMPTTPQVPATMDGLTWSGANAIEKILQDTDILITNMKAAWFFCGDLFSGEV